MPDAAVHVWQLSLAGSPAAIEAAATVLSREEREQAARFVFERDRTAYVLAHGLLREVLSRYAGRAAGELEFHRSPAGKPALVSASADDRSPGLSFNLSHSGGRALLAVSDGREIGVDIEKVRHDLPALEIAVRYFFRSEYAAIAEAPPHGRHEVFFRYWTAKEAVLKGPGLGLGFPLEDFEIRFETGLVCATVASMNESRLAGDWFVRAIPQEPGWAAAIAARGSAWTLETPPYPPPPSRP
ncbi:MAG: 4'-phosphopantetheinyl transferase superfamily protein [Gammaproteobacteria bacterium]|nr:4'-phosphopantetheinyl transferase superfamily protein [Gammaproteobacteria bacterium]